MKRSRGRRRHGGGQNNNPNRSYDSNGPDVKIRGTAQQVCDKYQNLARDASASGDRILAESYQQHAEHYLRVVKSIQATRQPSVSDQPQAHAQSNGASKSGSKSNGKGQDNSQNAETSNAETNGMEVVTPSENGSDISAPNMVDGSGPQPEADLPAFLQKPVTSSADTARPKRPRKKADDAAEGTKADATDEDQPAKRPRRKYTPKAKAAPEAETAAADAKPAS